MRLTYLLSITILFVNNVIAQEQLNHDKKAYLDSLGVYYQQATLPVYLSISSTPDGEGVPLTTQPQKTLQLEGHGVYSIKHEDAAINGNDEFKIYADGKAPSTKLIANNASKSLQNGKLYYGKNLEIKLMASDEMAGVDKMYYALNGKKYLAYKAISFKEAGDYTYNYYAVDKTGNVEAEKSFEFTVDLEAPNSYHNIEGISSDKVISTASKFSLSVSDSGSGVKTTYYKFNEEEYRPYKGGNIPFNYLEDEDHTLSYYSVDKVDNVEQTKTVSFYLDKIAPIMSADVIGDKFLVEGKVYFSGRTKLKLTAVDNKSGIKEVMYAINDGPSIKYEAPFYLPNRFGTHKVKFYAEDNTYNSVKDDFEHSIGLIYVDLTGPSINLNLQGPSFAKADTIFISPKTKIVLSGKDPEAGLKGLTYRLDSQGGEIDYSEPFVIKEAGFHTIDYFGYDNVNNKNSKAAYYITDSQGPKLSHQFAAPQKQNKYPSYTIIYLAAVDGEVGVEKITYRINSGKELLYGAPLKGFLKNQQYTIEVMAFDLLGNITSEIIEFNTDSY